MGDNFGLEENGRVEEEAIVNEEHIVRQEPQGQPGDSAENAIVINDEDEAPEAEELPNNQAPLDDDDPPTAGKNIHTHALL